MATCSLTTEELWEAQLREWPNSEQITVQDAFKWADAGKTVEAKLSRYMQLSMALQYPCVIYYRMDAPTSYNGEFRGIRFGMEGHEYMSLYSS